MASGIQYNLKKFSKKYLNKIGVYGLDRALMVPRMTTKEYLFFDSFLKENKDALYCESGSGGSTLMAEKIFDEMHSFETDAGFVKYMNGLLQKAEVALIPVGATGKFGYPEARTPENAARIAAVISPLLKDKTEKDRLVFIDGRSRVLTALEVHEHLSDNDRVLIHDFERKHYHAVLDVYVIAAQVEGLVVLQKKTGMQEKVNALKQEFSSDLR